MNITYETLTEFELYIPYGMGKVGFFNADLRASVRVWCKIKANEYPTDLVQQVSFHNLVAERIRQFIKEKHPNNKPNLPDLALCILSLDNVSAVQIGKDRALILYKDWP